MQAIPSPLSRHPRTFYAGLVATHGERVLAEETAVALTYDGATHAVMMASPSDLEDFGLGFSLSEGIVTTKQAIDSLEVVGRGGLGCEVRMYLAEHSRRQMAIRRRALTGPAGCGLCGIQSLEEAVRALTPVTSELHVAPGAIGAAMAALSAAQTLNRQARSIHAAAFWRPEDGLLALREDVGRHNALDKLAGALSRASIPGATGVVALTSRVSVEMVQKAARIGAPIVAAVSAPTALAVRVAEACGITLVAIARDASFEVFTHPARLRG